MFTASNVTSSVLANSTLKVSPSLFIREKFPSQREASHSTDSAIHLSTSLACGLTPLIAYDNSIPSPPYLSPLGISVWVTRIGKRSRRSGLQTPQSTVSYWTKPSPPRCHAQAVSLARLSVVCSKRLPLGTLKPITQSNKSTLILWAYGGTVNWRCQLLLCLHRRQDLLHMGLFP